MGGKGARTLKYSSDGWGPGSCLRKQPDARAAPQCAFAGSVSNNAFFIASAIHDSPGSQSDPSIFRKQIVKTMSCDTRENVDETG